jgi:hypothetical protein
MASGRANVQTRTLSPPRSSPLAAWLWVEACLAGGSQAARTTTKSLDPIDALLVMSDDPEIAFQIA